ncbi:MlaA family lipoprotein [Salidesulfovibrio brasiliensis]|uniref:MlaA family lipoprotein n=1 Tax=Salidesulfovibrio brasiliensis TaxID=221711 RepID=UPI0006D11628|nr:VacJ family lipoprotein [Salidesulfovibrio brasiliensis]
MTYRITLLLCLCLTLGACATISKKDPSLTLAPTGFKAPVSRVPAIPGETNGTGAPEADLGFLDVDDPWQPFNRSMYEFNARFDRAVYLPAVKGYETVVPYPARKGASNVIDNLNEVPAILNCSLQGRGKPALRSFIRLALNSTFGFLGLLDVASGWGIRRVETGVGDTLGVWGMEQGPYLVLPFLGPSNLRDAAGEAGDFALLWLEMKYVYDLLDVRNRRTTAYAEFAVRALTLRANIPFRYHQTGSPFEYELIRFLYTKKRELDVDKE